MTDQRSPDYDVVVLGTGAAGLVAALAAHVSGARVGLFEKSELVGGTTAVSGGVVWVPWHHLPVDGPELTREDARAYLDSLSMGYMEGDMVDAYIDSGPPLLDFLRKHSEVRFTVDEGSPDYNPEQPGGRAHGGRSLNPSPYPFARLGGWSDKVARFPADGFNLGIDAETRQRRRLRLGEDAVAELERTDARFMGAGLVGGLLGALLERGVEPRTGHRAVDVTMADGGVTGVAFETPDGVHHVRAGAVVLATGGFEWDGDLTKAFLHGPMVGPVSPPSNEGDGLRMAMKVGAQLWNMGDAWWAPVVHVPGDTWQGRPRYRTVRFERTRPRSILVNRYGERFVNEASNYNSLGKSFQVFDADSFGYRNSPAWLVVDDVHVRSYGFMGVPPDGDPPAWFNRSATLAELAERIEVDAEGLRRTVAAWNEHVEKPVDPDFHRGESAHDGWWGDWSQPTPAQQTLGPLDSPPFYAVPVQLGCLGTKGGPRVTTDGQVRHVSGAPIPGLYAAGNAMSAVTGQAYGGAGGTIGPAMVWGLRAGLHAALGRIPLDAV